MQDLQRKIVRWAYQGVTEAWQHTPLTGWVQVDMTEADEWKPGTFEASRICASQESFDNRKEGKIIW